MTAESSYSWCPPVERKGVLMVALILRQAKVTQEISSSARRKEFLCFQSLDGTSSFSKLQSLFKGLARVLMLFQYFFLSIFLITPVEENAALCKVKIRTVLEESELEE